MIGTMVDSSRAGVVALMAASVLLASACASNQPAAKQSQSGDRGETAETVELDRAMKLAIEERLRADLRRMQDGIYGYFHADQLNCGDQTDCDEPWHRVAQTPSGEPVDSKKKVFPGGVNQKLVLGARIPTGGELVPLEPKAEKHLQTTLAKLGLTEEALAEGSAFRYTYTTNGKTGPEARATLTAEADFDPESPERHTVVIRMSFDKDRYGVKFEPLEVSNEFE